MHRELVEERGWISEGNISTRSTSALAARARSAATGHLDRVETPRHSRRAGGGVAVCHPGAAVILALSMLYGAAAHLAWFAALFLGIKAAVLAIVVQAVLRLAGRALGTPFRKGAAVVSFLALFLFNAPFPLVVIGAGLAAGSSRACSPHCWA
jgi:chromate transporter